MSDWGPFDLGGMSAIVTGAGSGIGFGIARRFVEAGANVVVAAHNRMSADKAAGELAGGRGKAIAMEIEITADDAGEEMVETCAGAFGSVDILVNNAAVYPAIPTSDMDRPFFD